MLPTPGEATERSAEDEGQLEYGEEREYQRQREREGHILTVVGGAPAARYSFSNTRVAWMRSPPPNPPVPDDAVEMVWRR